MNKKIYRKWMALELKINYGFDILYTEPNTSKKGFMVFNFEDTEELRKAITEITDRRKLERLNMVQ